MALTNPLSTSEEVRNEFADIRHDAVTLLIERAVAEVNGQTIPSTVTDGLQQLAERLYAARVAYAQQNGEDVPERPAYLDPAPP